MQDERRYDVNTGRVTVGLIILTVGVLLLLERVGVVEVRLGRFIAPFVLILLGSVRLTTAFSNDGLGRDGEAFDAFARSRRRRHPLPGLWLILVGCWMLVTELHVFGIDYQTSWPLLIVAAGIVMIAGELVRRDRRLSGGGSGR